jgi:hypothetical protein
MLATQHAASAPRDFRWASLGFRFCRKVENVKYLVGNVRRMSKNPGVAFFESMLRAWSFL